jgi:hypothetical protein
MAKKFLPDREGRLRGGKAARTVDRTSETT